MKIGKHASTNNQIIRFAVVGVGNTIIDFLIYNLALAILVIQPFLLLVVIAKTISFSVALIQSFIFNRRWTFYTTVHEQYTKSAYSQFAWFALVGVSSLVVNVTVTSVTMNALLGVELYSDVLKANVAFVIATATTALLTFCAYKVFVFSKLPTP